MASFLGGAVGGLGGGTIGAAIVKLVADSSALDAGLASAEASTTAAAAAMSADAEAVSTSWGVAAADIAAANTTAATETATSWGVATAEIEGDALAIETAAAEMSSAVVAAYAAAGLAAAAFAKASIDAALGLEEAQNKLGNSIANSTKVSATQTSAFIDQANSISKLTGVHNDQIIASQSLQVQMGLTADEVKTLTPLIVDLSAKQGIDLLAATKAVGKAVNGSSGALGRLGVIIDKTAFAGDHYGTVLRGLGAAEGYAASKADIEPWKKLGNELHLLEEAAGAQLVPELQHIAEELDSIANHHLPSATSALGSFQFAMGLANPGIHSFGINLGDAGPNVDQFRADLAKLQTGLNNGTLAAGDAAGKVRELALANGYSASETDQMVASVQRLEAPAIRAANSESHLADVQHRAAEAAHAQKLAEDALAGGMLGLLSSLETLRTDQETVNKLKQQGKTHTDAYAAAVQAELTDQLAYTQSIKDLATSMIAAGDGLGTVRAKVFELGKEAGLSRSDIRLLFQSVEAGSKSAQDNLTGLGETMDTVRGKFREPLTIQAQIAVTTSGASPGSAAFAAAVKAALLRMSP
jgi:hypothetical protein